MHPDCDKTPYIGVKRLERGVSQNSLAAMILTTRPRALALMALLPMIRFLAAQPGRHPGAQAGIDLNFMALPPDA